MRFTDQQDLLTWFDTVFFLNKFDGYFYEALIKNIITFRYRGMTHERANYYL